jgi:acyl-CoA reductase-like NAD-dependent aldehyde dehydrogenase
VITGLKERKATLNPSVAEFLEQEPLCHFIGGRWTASFDDHTGEVIDPSDGSVLAIVAYGGKREIDAAARAAHEAFATWSRTPARERAVLLHRLADLIEREAPNLAQLESLDVGKAISAAEGFDIPFGVEGLRYFADLSTYVAYDVPLAIKNIEARTHLTPYGVCGFIFPWNFPFILAMWGLAPALAAGNSAVVKPSEVTPLSTLYLCKLIGELDFPAGLVNVVVGAGPQAGAPMPLHPLVRRMSFTGSPEVGRMIGAASGGRPIPCKLELGGKGAAIVFDDIDVRQTAEALAGAITLNTGQVCCTATRWILHDDIYDEFVDAASSALKKTQIGPALDPATEMGPLASKVHQERVLGYLERGQEEGASSILEGGSTSVPGYEGGFYVTPHLLAGDTDNVCFREEVFGPTAYVTRFKNEEEAVASVNSLEYGLANSVWSADLARANRVAEQMVAGNSWMNAHNVFAYGLPYGGVNLSGMGGGVNSVETFYDYLRRQTIARPL